MFPARRRRRRESRPRPGVERRPLRWARVARHAVVVDEEEERLAWMQLQTPPETHQ